MYFIIFIFCFLLLPVHAEDWPQLQHDPQHTGRSGISVVPQYTAKWVWVDEAHVTQNFVSQNGASINYPSPRTVILAGDTQPIVAEDKVFFGATGGEFYALNGANGGTVWKKQLGGAVLHTAAYSQGTVVTGCMDGKIYAFDSQTGTQKWIYQTDAGISAAPIIVNNVVYVGSRDGYFYAVNINDGSLRWKYRTIADNAGHPHSGAPIFQPAASDGTRIFFGAENMYFYALNADTGAELWRRKLGGTSFLYTWPVVDINNNIVMTFVMVPQGSSEYLMETELDSLPAKNTNESNVDYAARIWPQERQVILNWLNSNPLYKNFYVMRTTDGTIPYDVPMGRVGGIGYPGRAPVIDNSGRILMYWRVRSTTFLTGGTFGSKYTPDISAMNPLTGDRVWLTVSSGHNCELDNNFMLTVGGNYLYLNNHMRGAHCINLNTGSTVRMTSILADWDGANFRNWGNRLIWIGNDSNPSYMPPPSSYRSPQGDCGVVLAHIGTTPTMFIQESGHYQINFGCIACVQ